MRTPPRLSPSALMVCVCLLLLAMAGSATAGSLITGAKVKDGSLTGADIRNRSLLARDLSAGAVRAVRDGAPTSTLASGRTLRGVWAASGAYPANGALIRTAVTMPAPAPAALSAERVLIDGTPSDAGRCAGSPERPTAARGFVCVYVVHNLSFSSVSALDGPGGVSSRFGFVVGVQGTGTYANVEAGGTWAYTAP